ncbi:MAG TPA: hypothetical protein VMT99_01065 [Candidatus Paceibacterota bacterium]|nr:hypothetical protein [Candidatus Paceibacterota bacterium]
MMHVIPSVNCEDEACARKKIETLRGFLPEGSFVHGDVTDGAFSSYKIWNHPHGWSRLGAPYLLEVHLMVELPLDYAEDWFAAGARRLIVHVETLSRDVLHSLRQVADRYRGELMLTSRPETHYLELEPYVREFTLFEVLSVNPGAPGQAFLPVTLEKIRFLREVSPDATIEVDGGVNLETAKLVKSAGADTLVTTHYLFDSPDPAAAFRALEEI